MLYVYAMNGILGCRFSWNPILLSNFSVRRIIAALNRCTASVPPRFVVRIHWIGLLTASLSLGLLVLTAGFVELELY